MKFKELTPAQVKLLGQQMRLTLEGQIRAELKRRSEEVLELLDDDDLVMLLECDLRLIPNPRGHHANLPISTTATADGRGRHRRDAPLDSSGSIPGPVDTTET